jgi:hypothetical protein
MARYKRAHEAAGNGGSESPRLRRRSEAGEAAPAGEPEAEAGGNGGGISSELQQALRQPLAGETRVQGLLIRIDCSQKGVVFNIKVGNRVLKATERRF